MDTDGNNIIHLLPKIFREGKEKSEQIIRNLQDISKSEEIIIGTKNSKNKNLLYNYDNLESMKSLLCNGYGESIDLIYIDPPYLTMAKYKKQIKVINNGIVETIENFAYNDIWKGGIKEYLEVLFPRLYLMRKLLSNEGTIYIHLDYRTVHYVKLMMDYIFGEEMFINEIIWSYKSGGTSNKSYSRKHDTILMYSKTDDYIFNLQKEKSYNRGFKPYRFKGVKEYEDDIGWYTLINMRDVWDINIVGRTSRERVGYGTQKPEELLERIIATSSREGSIVADFFAGSGTTGVVADKMGRRFIMADKGRSSLLTIIKRLAKNNSNAYMIKKPFKNIDINKLNISDYTIEEKDKFVFKIKFKSYQLNIDYVKLSKNDKKILEEILQKDSLSIIDYIGIDSNYDGKNPSISYERYRKDDYSSITEEIKINIQKNRKNKLIYLKVIDIFGYEYIEVLEIIK